MNPLKVLVLGAVGARPFEEITAVDPALHVIDARGVFEVEYVQTWPAETVHRYVLDWEGMNTYRNIRHDGSSSSCWRPCVTS